MKLIVISSSGTAEGEPQMVTQMFEAGLLHYHLRKTKYTTSQLRDYIKQIPAKYHNRIVIHTHHDLARKFKLKGIHLTKTHKRSRVKTWVKIKLLQLGNPKLLVTTSQRTLSGLLDPDRHYDYVFLSPIFDSLTHRYQSGFSAHSLKSTLEKTQYKVIARSGIDIPVIPKIKELGFDGMAVYSAIWKKPNPVEQVKRFLNACKELDIEMD